MLKEKEKPGVMTHFRIYSLNKFLSNVVYLQYSTVECIVLHFLKTSWYTVPCTGKFLSFLF